MVKNMCMYPNYRILGDVKSSAFTKDGKECQRVSFAVSSYMPDSNGVFIKLFCYAFDSVAEEIAKANLQDGDIVTLFAEHNKYKSSKGIIEDRYRVISLNCIKKERKENHKDDKTTTSSDERDSSEKMVAMCDFMGFIDSAGLFS